MTLDEAIRTLRQDPAYQDLVRDAYLGRDVLDSHERFHDSAEWQAVRLIVGDRLADAVVLDLGAGIGIGAAAFVRDGARRVIAVEPDPSDEVGRGAMLRAGAGFEVVDGLGEALPLPDGSVDVAYVRQVLHHASDLDALLHEVARVLAPQGLLIACREHVVDDEEQLRAFLAAHPVNRLAGGEHAFSLQRYRSAILGAGLTDLSIFGPWDSIINAFPTVRSEAERRRLPYERLRRRIGPAAAIALAVPGVEAAIWNRIDRPEPGRLYSFVAHKP